MLHGLGHQRNRGGIEGVSYPIVADVTKNIARLFGVLDENSGLAFRGLFIMDKSGIIRHQLINDLPIGRSIEEVLRVLDAIEFHEKHGEVCPANWHPGQKAMTADHKGIQVFFSSSS